MKRYLAIVVLLVFAWSGNALADSTAISDAMNTQTQTAIGNQSTAATTTDVNQGQSQSQGGAAVLNSGNASVSFKDSFNGEAIRFLPDPTPVSVSTRGGPAVFGTPNYKDHGSSFVSMSKIVNMLAQIDLDEAEVEHHGDIDEVIQMINARDQEEMEAAAAEEAEEYAINFSLVNGEAPPKMNMIAIVTLSGHNDEKVNSATLAVRIAQIAKKLGGHKVAFLSEGSEKQIESSGWGIGLSYNMAEVSSSASDNGSVGAGGFGYSRGWGGYRSHVYLSAIIAE